MTQLLEEALSEVAKLPPAEQDALAAILMHALASERRWTESFSQSQDALARLAGEALAEDRAGLTKPLRSRCGRALPGSTGIFVRAVAAYLIAAPKRHSKTSACGKKV